MTVPQTVPETAADIPVADLMAFLRNHEGADDWCGAAEELIAQHLGVEVQEMRCGCAMCRRTDQQPMPQQRFTPVEGSPETVSRDSVMALIIAARAEHPGYSRSAIADAVVRWNLVEAKPAQGAEVAR